MRLKVLESCWVKDETRQQELLQGGLPSKMPSIVTVARAPKIICAGRHPLIGCRGSISTWPVAVSKCEIDDISGALHLA